MLAQSARSLGTAASFVVLGSSSVTNTGSLRVTGNVGVSPGNVFTGFSSDMFSAGDVRRNDALARQARMLRTISSRNPVKSFSMSQPRRKDAPPRCLLLRRAGCAVERPTHPRCGRRS